jgi:hypothetical protein
MPKTSVPESGRDIFTGQGGLLCPIAPTYIL